MKTRKAKFFLLIAAAVLVMTTTKVKAANPGSGFPNNTNTKLSNAISVDGVVVPVQAFIFRHLYGQDLILKLMVKNLGYKKVIYIQGLNGTAYALNFAY